MKAGVAAKSVGAKRWGLHDATGPGPNTVRSSHCEPDNAVAPCSAEGGGCHEGWGREDCRVPPPPPPQTNPPTRSSLMAPPNLPHWASTLPSLGLDAAPSSFAPPPPPPLGVSSSALPPQCHPNPYTRLSSAPMHPAAPCVGTGPTGGQHPLPPSPRPHRRAPVGATPTTPHSLAPPRGA